MSDTVTSPRSAYANRLREFPDFAFADAAAFAPRGRWREFFERRIGPAFGGRIIFEIGCSDAGYLVQLAAKFPAIGFIGLDWKCKALYDGAQRVANLSLSNIALLRGRGQDIFKIFAEREVDEVWLFHPDPCDRDVELKNRLFGEPFLLDAHRVLRDGTSSFSLKTDHPGYYQWALGLLGLPQPTWFKSALGAVASGTPFATSDATPGTPRVRVRDLMLAKDIPPKSNAICSRFNVSANSPNFWHDPTALAHTAGKCFSGEATAFESRFMKKRFPIYYMELKKKLENAHQRRL